MDALVGDTLVSVWRQLRAGYSQRPGAFPQSVILCGVRDLRDYRIHARSEPSPITGGSAFNIKAKSMRLGDSTAAEVTALLGEHTADTGQVFTPEALALVWELTQGQPWLVNALAYHACFRMVAGRDRHRPIDADLIARAKEYLIVERVTHLDQLVLMAFLHRVVNGDGTLEREYAIGFGRMDLCLRYGAVTLGMELKVWRDGAPDPLADGLVQLDGYLDGLGLATGWLVIFDRRAGQPPIAQRTSVAVAMSPAGRSTQVIRA
ncbi:MAG TPA: hypothetical protein VES73_09305 [Lamprocystis sp. (in: g-proteobacteria)]|nr:hypothetical protein [Lamprocystis sp. (in: g-proteobacteria)]